MLRNFFKGTLICNVSSCTFLSGAQSIKNITFENSHLWFLFFRKYWGKWPSGKKNNIQGEGPIPKMP